MKAALYARFSTEQQRRESIDDQFRQCDRVALAQGLKIVARFSDRGISGGTTERPGYQELLTAARARSFDVIVAEDLSRLWRSRAEYGARSAELEDLGIHILTCVGDDTRRDGFMILSIKSAIAEHARKETSYRTRRALEGLALAGKSPGGRCYGFPSPKVPPRVTEAEVRVVQGIFARYAAGGVTPYGIANELNRARVRAPRCRYWSGGTVARILSNPRYAGRAIWGATVSAGGARDSRGTRHVERPGGPLVVRQTAPMVSPELWDKVNGSGALK